MHIIGCTELEPIHCDVTPMSSNKAKVEIEKIDAHGLYPLIQKSHLVGSYCVSCKAWKFFGFLDFKLFFFANFKLTNPLFFLVVSYFVHLKFSKEKKNNSKSKT